MPAMPKGMQPGMLRKPLTLMTRADTPSASGGGTPAYTSLFDYPVWAYDQHGNAKSIDQAGKLITVTFHTYTIRYHPDIQAGMYVQDPNYANKLYIQGVVDPDGTRHWMQLLCQDIEG